MTTITIPENLIKEKELILVPRKKYEELLRLVSKKKRAYTQIDKELDEAIREYKTGKYFGPFNNVRDLMKSLQSKK